jgi:hypothetical protein
LSVDSVEHLNPRTVGIGDAQGLQNVMALRHEVPEVRCRMRRGVPSRPDVTPLLRRRFVQVRRVASAPTLTWGLTCAPRRGRGDPAQVSERRSLMHFEGPAYRQEPSNTSDWPVRASYACCFAQRGFTSERCRAISARIRGSSRNCLMGNT